MNSRLTRALTTAAAAVGVCAFPLISTIPAGAAVQRALPQTVCTIEGTPDNDVLRGTNGNDVICGFGGDDTLQGLGGDDVLFGGDGDDILVGGAGSDVLFGGDGDDLLVDTRDPGTADGGAGADDQCIAVSGSRFTNCERINTVGGAATDPSTNN